MTAQMLDTIRARFCTELPSSQTALDIFKGAWRSKLPGPFATGDQERFSDTRVEWFMKNAGLDSLHGVRVLELGPFEAYNTWQIGAQGATDVTAVEGNTVNFLKCLVVKEVLGIPAKFLCGDFIQFLRAADSAWDLVWACGILYHQVDPVELLDLAMKRARRWVFVWTHYYDPSILASPHAPEFDRSKDTFVDVDGERIRLHFRSYMIEHYGDRIPLYYESGFRPHAFWMTKQDILRRFEKSGYRTEVMVETQLDHLPVIAFVATRDGRHG